MANNQTVEELYLQLDLQLQILAYKLLSKYGEKMPKIESFLPGVLDILKDFFFPVKGQWCLSCILELNIYYPYIIKLKIYVLFIL